MMKKIIKMTVLFLFVALSLTVLCGGISKYKEINHIYKDTKVKTITVSSSEKQIPINEDIVIESYAIEKKLNTMINEMKCNQFILQMVVENTTNEEVRFPVNSFMIYTDKLFSKGSYEYSGEGAEEPTLKGHEKKSISVSFKTLKEWSVDEKKVQIVFEQKMKASTTRTKVVLN